MLSTNLYNTLTSESTYVLYMNCETCKIDDYNFAFNFTLLELLSGPDEQ